MIDGHVLRASPLDAFAAGHAERRADADRRQPPRERRDAASRHHGGRVPGPGAAALRRSRRRVPGALSRGDRRRRRARRRTRAPGIRRASRCTSGPCIAPARRARKVFTYFWDHPLPGPDVETYGAFHTSEVPYVMNTLAMSKRPFTDDDRRHRRSAVDLRRQLHQDRRPERSWPAVLAGRRPGRGPDDASRRHLRADRGRRQPGQAALSGSSSSLVRIRRDRSSAASCFRGVDSVASRTSFATRRPTSTGALCLVGAAGQRHA